MNLSEHVKMKFRRATALCFKEKKNGNQQESRNTLLLCTTEHFFFKLDVCPNIYPILFYLDVVQINSQVNLIIYRLRMYIYVNPQWLFKGMTLTVSSFSSTFCSKGKSAAVLFLFPHSSVFFPPTFIFLKKKNPFAYPFSVLSVS
jgi:hypothetical protein